MTIQKPIIEELRYVNGQPDPSLRPDQTRINWAKNGENINGASGDTTSDGVLNRAAVEIQENVLNTHNNTKSHQIAIETLVDTVNELSGGGDANLGQRIFDSEFDIDVLQKQFIGIKGEVGVAKSVDTLATGLHKKTDLLKSAIGVRNSLDIPNEVENNDTIRKDLFFIKRRIGNDRNYDVNGNPVHGNSPSGIKYQIDDLYNRTSTINTEIGENGISQSINGRIYELEQNSQAGSVANLRNEIGDSIDRDPERSVYLRLDDAESSISDNDADITALQDKVTAPTTGLVDRVAVTEQTLSDVSTQVSTSVQSIEKINDDIGLYADDDEYAGAVKARMSVFSDNITKLWTRLGTTDDSTGTASFRIASLESSLGDRVNPSEFTAWYTIQENSGSIKTSQTDIEELMTIVGKGDDEVGTLRRRVVELEAQLDNALITSDTPSNIDITTAPTDMFSLFNVVTDLEGYTYKAGSITRNGIELNKTLAMQWVVVSPTTTTITIRIDFEHSDGSSTSTEKTRTLRANQVTPVTVTDVANLKDASVVKVLVSTADSVTVEHESFVLKI